MPGLQDQINAILDDYEAERNAGSIGADVSLDDYAMVWVSARAAEWRREWTHMHDEGMHAAECAVMGY